MSINIPIQLHHAPLDRLQRPMHDLRISVLDRCNFRCPYCMPEDEYPRDHQFLGKAERLRFEEIERIVGATATLGVRKLRLTGGEPLLRRELPELVRMLSAVPGIDDIALTTNGSLLPAQVGALRDAGLDRITLSLDTLDPDTYRSLSGGRGEFVDALAAIAAAEAAGYSSIKINCVVIRGVNDAHVLDLAGHFRGTGHVLRYIEYMDVGTCNAWDTTRVVPSSELRARIAARWPIDAVGANYPGEVAERYRYRDGEGEIGFISSVSQPFCGDCSRARLSADGRLYTCLFGKHGHDLRSVMRNGVDDAGLHELIAAIWRSRDDRYSELRGSVPAVERERVEMYEIGG